MAYIAAIVIAVVSGIINWLLGVFWASLSAADSCSGRYSIVAAVVLMFSARIVPGLKVKGFGGALVGAIVGGGELAVTLILGGLIPA